MITIDGNSLTILELAQIAFGGNKVLLSKIATEAVSWSHRALVKLAQIDGPIYGVNTGFGIFSDKDITPEQSITLNKNLIFSHAVATSDPLPQAVVRAAMAIRVNTLAKGVSGIQPEIVNVLIEMLNKEVTPLVSSRGSLGSSGDLCLLAQIGLVIIGEPGRREEDSGLAYFGGKLLSGKEALEKAGIQPVTFSYKDGLALINGATFSAALTALSVHQAAELSNLADVSHALSLEAMCGCSHAYHPGIHALRNHAGQITSAKKIQALISGSSFVDSTGTLQDAYSLRCAPQVHGSVRDTIEHAEKVLTAEINAATDNPLMVADDLVISGGNFHGEPIGMAADFLSIALAELGAISERRTFRLMDEKLSNGLPAMLVDPEAEAGLHSGVMILQYTAAALSLENQTLATPDSTKSLPASANQEDHNANAYNAARHLGQIVENVTKIIAIELYCAARAIHLRMINNEDLRLGQGTRMVYEILQKELPYQTSDIQWRAELEKFYELLRTNSEIKQRILSVVNNE